MDLPLFEPRSDLSDFKEALEKINAGIHKIIVGNEEVVNLIIISLIAGGNVLLEGVPGIAKTLMAKSIAKSLAIPYSRIQFTPDLMPSDILGTTLFNLQTSVFEFKKGPIFSGLVLIDEINRSPAKTQSALFEVMEEKQITIDGNRYDMHRPFMVVATQNPIEQEGTYRLPEAQLDRFMFKINMKYPNIQEEIEILDRENHGLIIDYLSELKPSISSEEIMIFQRKTRQIRIEKPLIEYIAELVNETRNHKSLFLGASPRASIMLLNGSKALAALQGRDFSTPDDIRYLAPFVLNHRIMVHPEREMEGVDAERVIQEILKNIEVPR